MGISVYERAKVSKEREENGRTEINGIIGIKGDLLINIICID